MDADPQRLVTRAVSVLVDDGRVDAAEALWLEYGENNDRALAKLVLGCSREEGGASRAVAYFKAACDRRAAAVRRNGGAPVAYLTGLFNAVLRSTLSDSNSSSSSVRLDLEAVRIAARHRIRFDTDTYSVLISHLSRRIPGDDDDCRKAVARIMLGLFVRMCKDCVPVDDMVFCHLVPVWVYLDKCPLVTMFWRLHTRGRPPHKVVQIRRHVMHQAEHWGEQMANRVAMLLVQKL
ncbi:hypothetical protein IWW38_003995 [Coemansia aciculifera]|uniref:Uncharacterized protein n=1 Tax=Coemansia aciculifera TaxID=417176 RepID=A0ACC1M026_9FUNG|nr:hypothetical protein IWW38_003995 [Coemansia aciculifera]